MADALCWLLGSRHQILDLLGLEEKGAADPALAEELPGVLNFLMDLAHVQSARAAGEVGRICAELVFGYNAHPAWTNESCNACYGSEEIEALEGIVPGIAAMARTVSDVMEAGEAHAAKAGPCVNCAAGVESFTRLRSKLDTCLTGARLAKDRAAESLVRVMIPEALDYPV